MERTHLAVLAIAVTVVVFVGLQLFSSDDPAGDQQFAADVVPGMVGADGTSVRRLPLSREQSDREGERRRPGKPSDRMGSDRRGSRPGGGGGTAGSQDVIAGSGRQRNVVGSGGGGRSAAGSGGGSDMLPGAVSNARIPGAPQPRSARDLNLPTGDPERRTFEFVDDQPQADPNAPLLSIPFKGDLDIEAGGEPTQATGLVNKDDGVEFSSDAQLTFPAGGHVNGEAGSISFEIQPNWAGNDETNASMVQIRNEHVWENTLSIVKNLNSLRFIIIDEGGVERNVNMLIDTWQPGESHQVTATWGEALMSLYVDGNLVGQNTMPHGLNFFDTTPIHIGSDFPGTSYGGAGATIRDFQLYGRALTGDEVTRR
jgi:hypothetical protein